MPAAEPVWVKIGIVLDMQRTLVRDHGGDPGIRDLSLLESALARPRNIFLYTPTATGLAELAAAYASGIIQNHPFIDGNKRTAVATYRLFLLVNGHELLAKLEDEYAHVIRLATHLLTESDFAAWLRPRLRPVDSSRLR